MPYAEQLRDDAEKVIRLLADGYLPKEEFQHEHQIKDSELMAFVKTGRFSKETAGRYAFYRVEDEPTPDNELWPIMPNQNANVSETAPSEDADDMLTGFNPVQIVPEWLMEETVDGESVDDMLAGFTYLSDKKADRSGKNKRTRTCRDGDVPYLIKQKSGEKRTCLFLSLHVDLASQLLDRYGKKVCVRSRSDGAVAISAPIRNPVDDREISGSSLSRRKRICLQAHAHNFKFVKETGKHYLLDWRTVIDPSGSSVVLFIPRLDDAS